jgi:hypothetical protein
VKVPLAPTVVDDSFLSYLKRLSASIAAGWNVEHAPDGTHKAIHERGRTTAMGEWVSVPYRATNFTAASGTWTVESSDQTTYAYTLIGQTAVLTIVLSNTSLSVSPATLAIALPAGLVSAHTAQVSCRVYDNGTERLGSFHLPAGATTLTVFNIVAGAIANFAASVHNTHIIGQITFEVQ